MEPRVLLPRCSRTGALLPLDLRLQYRATPSYPALALTMRAPVLLPSLGLLSSGAIAFVYKHSNFSMVPIHAMMWGVGQTVIHAAVGFTRILATL